MSTAPGNGAVPWLAAALEERLALAAPARRLRLALADRIISGYAKGRPIRVLDAGAADGLLSLALAKRRPHWSLVGVDVRESLLEGARARARGLSLRNARFVTADLTLPLPEAEFDVVLALECLSEIPDDEAALASMAAALVPGGLFVVQVPERDWRPVLPGSDPTWRHEVRHGYSAEEMAAALRRAGLDRIELRPTYHAIVMAAQELGDRIKGSSLAVRAAAFPPLAASVWLERRGLRPGRAKALLGVARRPE